MSIYGLIDPRTQELRYVGKAVNVRRRVADHLRESEAGGRTRKCNWLRSVARYEQGPEVEIIEVTTRERAVEAERFWIAYFRMIGCDLTNLTAGGDGSCGWRMPEEVKQKIGAKARGRNWTPAQRAKITSARTGNPVWGQWNRGQKRPKIAEAKRGSTLSAEHRAHIGIAIRGRALTPEHRAHIAEARRGWRPGPVTLARMSAGQQLRQQRVREAGGL